MPMNLPYIVVTCVILWVAEKGYDKLPLPVFNRTFSTQMGPFKMEGSALLSRGIFSNITSLERHSDAMIYKLGDKTIFSLTLGLRDIMVAGEDFKVSLWMLSSGGEISAKCSNNEILMRFYLIQ